MSRKGVVGPLRLNRNDAAIAATAIEERTKGIDLEGTPFAALPAFGRKLRAALRRRRVNATEIVMWTVDRNEAEAGFAYLMLFTREDVPEIFLSIDEMDAVHNVALVIVSALPLHRGHPGLDREEIERQVDAWHYPEKSTVDIPNPRWVRRLKRRMARSDAFWQTAWPLPPLTPLARTLLGRPRKNTGN